MGTGGGGLHVQDEWRDVWCAKGMVLVASDPLKCVDLTRSESVYSVCVESQSAANH